MIRSGYSFKTAFGKLPDVFSRMNELGWTHNRRPLADYLSTFGFRRWRDLCHENGMQPCYGVELPVSPDPHAKKIIADRWTFMAMDDLRVLHDLIALATSRQNPALSYKEACQAADCFKITGNHLLLDEMISGPGNLYVGLSPSTPKQLYDNAFKLGHQFCAMSCNLYPRPEDKEKYRIALGKPGGGNKANTQTYPLHILSDDEWHAAVDWFVSGVQQECAIINRDYILHRCNAFLGKAELLKPEWSNFWDEHDNATSAM